MKQCSSEIGIGYYGSAYDKKKEKTLNNIDPMQSRSHATMRRPTREIQRVPLLKIPPNEQPDPAGCMDSPDEPPKPKPIPEWVLLRPFQYNGRVLAAAIPGLCLVISLTGELLLSIVVIGAIILHLIDSAGAQRQTIIAYLCIFIAVQLSIIYSAIPLLWISIFNIIILVILNMFVVLTGGWVLLQFPALVREEAAFAEMIEISLFTVYPVVSVALTTWIVGTLLSTDYLHYMIIIHGFLLLRLFITPNQPSFRKTNFRDKQSGIAYVIGAPEIALLLMAYFLTPLAIFSVLNFWNLAKYEVLLECVLVISTPLFLASLLELRSWTEYVGIPYQVISTIRWVAGFVTLTTLCAILMQIKSSVLVPWLLPVTILNVFLGSLSISKQYSMKAAAVLVSIVISAMYFFAITGAIPWHIDLPDVNLSRISMMLIVCAVLSVACCIVANTRNKQLLSTLLLCDMAMLVYMEYILSKHQLCSPLLLVGTAILAIYLLTRLYNAEVIAWHAAWVGTALCSINILPLAQIYNSNSIEPTAIRSGCIFMTLLITTKLIFFESRKEMPISSIYQYVFCICISIMLLYLSVLNKLWIAFLSTPPTVQDATALYIMICGTICLKLTFYHVRHLGNVYKANILVIIAGGIILILQPKFPSSVLNIADWFILFSLCIILTTAVGLNPPSQNLTVLLLQAIMVGFAMGTYTCSYLLGPRVSFTHNAMYSGICALCAFIGLILWHWDLATGLRGTSKIPNITPQFIMIGCLAIATFIFEISTIPTGQITLSSLALPSMKLNCVVYLILGMMFKVHCMWQESVDPFNCSLDNVPTLINISAIVCYLLAILNCPIDPWEIWNCTCSVVLLLLHQKDSILLTSLPANKQSGVLIVTCLTNLYLATIYHCTLWHDGIGFFGIVELFLLIGIHPLYIALGRELCSDNFSSSLELVVFVAPLNTILFIVGSSYTSWVLGTLGLGLATWFIVHKLSENQ